MSDFILEYDMLESIAAYSKSLGKRAGEYEESLEKKIISGIASITGPSTGYLQSASDSIRDKVNALKQKSDAFYHYAEQITNLLETAERIDQEVADAITAQREYFLDHHKSLRLDDWKAKLLGLLVDLKNSIPLLGTIADLLEGLNTVIESLEDSIRHWYECEGGKYVIGEIAAVAEACLAVAIFAATFPISTFTGFCLAVGFGIAALNSCVNVKTSYKAAEAAMDGNPALAEIYGKQDTLSDVLRQKNYGNGTMNDLSNFTAGALDVTEAVCITVGMAGQIVNLFKKSYNLLKYRKSLNYSGLQNNLESGSVKLENVIKEEYKNTKNIGLADDTGAVGELEKSVDLIKDSGKKSFRELMDSEDLIRYEKYWDKTADFLAKEKIDLFRQQIINKIVTKTTGGKIESKVATVVIDTDTGKIYKGLSGIKGNPTRGDVNDFLAKHLENSKKILEEAGFKKGSLTNYPLDNCGEFNAINSALNDGANIKSLKALSVDIAKGTFKEACDNCKFLYGDLIKFINK